MQIQTPTMRAKLPAPHAENAKRPTTTAEISCIRLVAYGKGREGMELREVITARFYSSGRDGMSPLRCCVWVRSKSGGRYSGSGRADGCGYHKYSAALQGALDSAGIELFGSPYGTRDEKPNYRKRAHIDGAGDGAMRDAMHAIAIACGYRGPRLILDY